MVNFNFQALYTCISQLASLTETHVVCITKYYMAEQNHKTCCCNWITV